MTPISRTTGADASCSPQPASKPTNADQHGRMFAGCGSMIVGGQPKYLVLGDINDPSFGGASICPCGLLQYIHACFPCCRRAVSLGSAHRFATMIMILIRPHTCSYLGPRKISVDCYDGGHLQPQSGSMPLVWSHLIVSRLPFFLS
jgi:hypothetical protein